MRAALGWLGRIWRADVLSAFGLAVLGLLIFLGIFGQWLPLGDPTRIAAGPRLGPPSLAFPFGTDELGRSFLPRVVQGIRATFLLSAIAVLISAVIGTALGMAAGYFGRGIDIAVARGADILFAFPALLVGLLVAAVLGPGQFSAISVISIATLPLLIRVVRSVTLSVAGRGFVIAARVAGASWVRILAVHILPNVMGAVMVQLTYALSIGMIIESALSFLGLGVQPPEASLGSLLRQGSAYLTIAPWMVLSSGAVLSLAIMSVNLVGDAVRDMLEPLKGRALT
ncbi:ABC transporter permease [Roseovarius nanhaiticus]|uniref:Peptide/nickel transport system permease protein n=1 Tax=Roseovarius nanhaiticus TaxID=573024 RepID=A0A1N7ERX6_9RHOB|nr:ABC transporter permease [Roseovarius nanhaiticus]SEK67801.1 peptide/nickel transport system permease protein [Roseovarius nanhaiticus]SIR90858.1 peptide/nickel transport system permease protein [Roseovarius nanhaiticus]